MVTVEVDGVIVPIFDNRDDAVKAISEEQDLQMRRYLKHYNFFLLYSTEGFRQGSLSEDRKLVVELLSKLKIGRNTVFSCDSAGA